MDTPGRTRAGAVVAGLLLLLLVAGGTAGGSLVPVHRAPAASLPTTGAQEPDPDRPSAQPLTLSPVPPSADDPSGGDDGSTAEAVVLLALLGVLVVAALVVAGLLVRRIRLIPRSRPAALEPTGPVVVVPDDGPDASDGLTRRVAEAAEAARTAASGAGSARQLLLECWVALERAVAEAGLVRGPGETSAELTRRVLAGRLVDPEPLNVLHGLYERARYAPGETDEAGPLTAAALLQRIQSDLVVRR